jgi:hypothetical protein
MTEGGELAAAKLNPEFPWSTRGEIEINLG